MHPAAVGLHADLPEGWRTEFVDTLYPFVHRGIYFYEVGSMTSQWHHPTTGAVHPVTGVGAAHAAAAYAMNTATLAEAHANVLCDELTTLFTEPPPRGIPPRPALYQYAPPGPPRGGPPRGPPPPRYSPGPPPGGPVPRRPPPRGPPPHPFPPRRRGPAPRGRRPRGHPAVRVGIPS